MIRKQQAADAGVIADLWLNTNIEAHAFIPAQYWRDNLETVREALAQAEVYVYADGSGIRGFIGLQGDCIAGIFVEREARSGGIGRQLLDFVKERNDRLTLHVYEKNPRAQGFYQREGFAIQQETTDENTGEREYVMIWERQKKV